MENLITTVIVILGLVVRIGLPVAVTLLVVRWLLQLDSQWQNQANEESVAEGVIRILPGNVGCWEINGCSSEKRSHCTAYAHPESPCWQVFRNQSGALQERCLGCKVFKESPVPVTA